MIYAGQRAIISLTGNERHQFLQALISNDVMQFNTNNTVCYATLLTPQGKLLYDFFVHERDEALWLECAANIMLDLGRQLRHYKLNAAIELRPYSQDCTAYYHDTPPDTALLHYKDPRHSALGLRVVIPTNDADTIMPKTIEPYYAMLISHAIPIAEYLPSKAFLLDCNFDKANAISFTKGCYIGQEVTARMHYRGKAKYKLVTVSCAALENTNYKDDMMLYNNNNEPCGTKLLSIGQQSLWRIKRTAMQEGYHYYLSHDGHHYDAIVT